MPFKHLIAPSVLGGITLFIWGAVAHTALPLSEWTLLGFANDDAVTQAVIANAPRSGVYFMPYVPQRQSGMSEEQFKQRQASAQEKLQRGPFMFAAVRLTPMGSYAQYMGIQLLTEILTALLVCLVLARAKEFSVRSIVTTAVCIGLAGFASATLPQWNWYGFSDAYTLAELFDVVVGFLLAGLVIAFVLRRRIPTAG
jgi:hypothetical protein